MILLLIIILICYCLFDISMKMTTNNAILIVLITGLTIVAIMIFLTSNNTNPTVPEILSMLYNSEKLTKVH